MDSLARIPPHDLDAERAVLGAILLEGTKILPAMSLLRSSDFYTEAHRAIFSTVLDMGAAGSAIDLITLSDELRRRDLHDFVGGPAALALLVENASISAHARSYAAIVRQKAILREIIQTATQAVASAFDDHDDPSILLERARDAFDVVARRAVVAENPFPAMTLGELMRLDVPDPIFLLDKWIPEGGLTFIVGDSEAFKSWFAMLLAVSIAAGLRFMTLGVQSVPTLVISEENGVKEDKRRGTLIARGLGISEDDADRLPFYIVSETSFNFDEPAKYNAMRAFVQEKGIKLIVFDSFVRMHKREEKDAGQMNALYMERMKPLIRDGVALIPLHHRRKTPSGANGHAPTSDNDDIRGSGDIRAAASAVLFLKKAGPAGKVIVLHNKARGFEKQDAWVFAMRNGETADGKKSVVFAHEGKPVDALDRRDACKAAILEYAAKADGQQFTASLLAAYFKDEKKNGRPSFSRKVFEPVLAELSKNNYPLMKDEAESGKAKWYKFVNEDAPEGASGDSDDVPF